MQPNISVGAWRLGFSAVWLMLAIIPAAQAQTNRSESHRDDALHRLAVQLANSDGVADARGSDAAPREGVATPLAPLHDIDAHDPAAHDADTHAPAEPVAVSRGTMAEEPVEAAGERRRTLLHQRGVEDDGEGIDEAGTVLAGGAAGRSSGGAGWVLQTITALGIVIGLILLFRWGYTKLTGQVAATGSSPVMEVLSRTTIAPRNQVLLVRLGQRILVVGDSPAGLRTLANLDEPEEVASLLAAVSAAKPESISGGFSQLLNRFNGDYERDVLETEGGDHNEHRIDRARNSVSGLLSRLRTLGNNA